MTKTITITEPMTEPMLDDVPPTWPPLAHIIREEDKPVKEGTIALCGTKLMGLDLGLVKDVSGKICEKCEAIFFKELEK